MCPAMGALPSHPVALRNKNLNFDFEIRERGADRSQEGFDRVGTALGVPLSAEVAPENRTAL